MLTKEELIVVLKHEIAQEGSIASWAKTHNLSKHIVTDILNADVSNFNEEVARVLGYRLVSSYVPIPQLTKKEEKAKKVPPPARKVILTENNLDEILENIETGVSYAEIAKHFGCSTTNVRNFLDRRGIRPVQNQSIPDDQIEVIRELSLTKSDGDIAKEYNVAPATVGRFRKKHKLPGRADIGVKIRKWTDEEKQKLIAMKKAGLGWKQIAEELGRNYSQVAAQGFWLLKGAKVPNVREKKTKNLKIEGPWEDAVAKALRTKKPTKAELQKELPL